MGRGRLAEFLYCTVLAIWLQGPFLAICSAYGSLYSLALRRMTARRVGPGMRRMAHS